MADHENPVEAFRHALASAARALSGDPETEVSLTSDMPSASGKSIKAPLPGRTLAARDVAEARGFADAAALKLRYHNPAMHARGQPADDIARAVFDAAEQARVEALGARDMAGVRANLDGLTEMRLRTDPLVRARTREEVPLSSAVGLLVRERLTGQAPPDSARPGLEFVAEWIEDKAGADLDALALALDDQRAFADLMGKVLRDLELVEEIPSRDDATDGGDEEEGGDSQTDGEEDEGDEQQSGQGDAEIRGQQDEGEDEAGEDSAAQPQEMDDGESALGEDGEEGILPTRPNRPLSDLPPQFDYRIFTTRYDEVIGASDLCDSEELGRLRAYLDQQLIHLQGSVTKLANRLQRRLMAQQSRSWAFDQEEGMLDAA
ncbi:MAG: cobaltochelatase subunit CobT, partial [Pseudomonadota bacterium]|nr:cobaltochelatase subunit CobT [Pseudomonadota bacterium]